MAAPLHVTTKAMSGKFTLNKSLSDNSDEILRLQGVSWFKRSAISLFTPTLCIKHTTDNTGVEHLDLVTTLSGGLNGAMSQEWILDWQERDEDNYIFGLVTGRLHRVLVEEITDEFLKDWTQDSIDNGIILSEYWSTPGKNSYTWKSLQAWGLATVNGERRFVRLTTFTSPRRENNPIFVRLVYDYIETI